MENLAKNTKNRALGIAEVLTSGLLFGLLGPLGKKAFALGLLPLEILSLRFFAGGLILLIFSSLLGRQLIWPRGRQWIYLGLLGIAGYALFSSLYFFAIRELSASLAVLLLYTYPLMVATLATLMGIEKLTPQKIFCLLAASVGMVMLLGTDFSVMAIRGFIFGLGSAFFYSLYILASGKWLNGINAFWATSWIQILAGMVLLGLAFEDAQRPLQVLSLAWPILLAMTLFCTLGAMSLFQSGLQKLSPTETSLLSLSEPLTGIFLSLTFIGETLSLLQVIGGVLILVSLVILSLSSRRRSSPKVKVLL